MMSKNDIKLKVKEIVEELEVSEKQVNRYKETLFFINSGKRR